MPRISRRELQEAFAGRSIDTQHLPQDLSAALQAAGVAAPELSAIAGGDHVISGSEELGRLYDRLSSARTESGQPVDLTKSGSLYAALDRAAAAPASAAPPASAPARSGIGASARREMRLELNNPLADTSTHASHYAAVPRLVGAALDEFGNKYPAINRNFAGRFLEASALFAAQVPWMVVSHEFGHYRAADKFGWDPSVEITGWPSGVTHYGSSGGATEDQRNIASAAGMNQEAINGAYMFRDWARAGEVRYSEAMSYLLAQTNPALYAIRTSVIDNPASSDDVAAYVRRVNERGIRLSTGQLAAIGLATDLLSAPVWASLIGEGRFLATGDKTVSIPKFELGSTELTFPNFHNYLSTQGPIVGGELFVNPQGRIPLQLSMDVRLDDGATAIGAKAYDLAMSRHISFNPFIRTTVSSEPGILLGSDVRLQLNDRFSLIGSASFNARDLLGEVEGRENGLNLSLSIGVRR